MNDVHFATDVLLVYGVFVKASSFFVQTQQLRSPLKLKNSQRIRWMAEFTVQVTIHEADWVQLGPYFKNVHMISRQEYQMINSSIPEEGVRETKLHGFMLVWEDSASVEGVQNILMKLAPLRNSP